MIRWLLPEGERGFVSVILVLLGAAIGALCWIAISEPVADAQHAVTPSGATAAPNDRRDPPDPRTKSVQFVTRNATGESLVPETVELARQLNAPDGTAEQDVEVLQTLLAYFRRVNDGANPSGGLNEEIVEALRGRNARRLAVLPPDLAAIGSDGQLLDRWGTPYFLHPISRNTLEIRSAGPDGKLWTADDVVGSGDSERLASPR